MLEPGIKLAHKTKIKLQAVCGVPTICGKTCMSSDNSDAHTREQADCCVVQTSSELGTNNETRVQDPMHPRSGGLDANTYTGK